MTSSKLSPTYAAPWHAQSPDQSLTMLQSDRAAGLTEQQIRERQIKFGPNELQEAEGRSSWEILFDQFKNIMLVMLIAVAMISGILDFMSLAQGANKSNDIPFKDTIAILAMWCSTGCWAICRKVGRKRPWLP